jgi:hypothetical protein
MIECPVPDAPPPQLALINGLLVFNQIPLAEQLYCCPEIRRSLIPQFLTNRFQCITGTDQSFKATFKVLGHVELMLWIDL